MINDKTTGEKTMSDTFRKEYIEDEILKNYVDEIKSLAESLEEHINIMERCREQSLALTKLEELTQPQPKYKVGQEVWHALGLSRCTILRSVVESFYSAQEGFVYYLDNSPSLNEDWLYQSREALIDAQLEYWTNLKFKGCDEAILKDCPVHDAVEQRVDADCHSPRNHNPEGATKWNDFGTAIEWKCKHCGEFYK